MLSVHHAAIMSMYNIPIVKLIENNRDRRFLQIIQTITIAGGPLGLGLVPPQGPAR